MTSVARPTRALGRGTIAALAALQVATAAHAADDADADALALTSAPVEAAKSGNTSLFVEGALGRGNERAGSGWRNLGRATVDYASSIRLAPQWQAVVSDRLDMVHPALAGAKDTVNSLRELYVSWQASDGASVVDLGRVNLRYGPAYGYNPTDFFRSNTLRTVTTADPLALRQDRLGTFVLRGQQTWGDNAASLTYAPKLASAPTNAPTSIDAGATNNVDHALLTFSTRFSDRVSTQWLVYKEDGLPPEVGISGTALLTDAIVAYVEGTRGREPTLLARTLSGDDRQTRNRWSTGLTITPTPKLSITAEYQYNGFALDRTGWSTLGATRAAYLLQAFSRQEISSRDAWFAYATLKDAGMRNLDATALMRINGNDHSRLAWMELRYNWPAFQLALQFQQQNGGETTEYGVLPYRRSVQLVGTYRLF